MLLDFLDDVFLLHLALETAQSVLQGFAFLDDDFSHVKFTPNPVRIGNLRCRILRCTAHEHYRMQSAICARARGQDYGASCSQFGHSVSSNLCEKWASGGGNWRGVVLRYTSTELVKVSKMLDLVGIRSIFDGRGILAGPRGGGVPDTRRRFEASCGQCRAAV
jgi:hypothetical protein